VQRTSADLYDIVEIYTELLAGNIILWVIIIDDKLVASLTTRVIQYPKAKTMAIDWVSGTKMSKWLPKLIPILDSYARDNGCKYITGMGRDGWTKALEPHGYKTWSPIYRKEL